MPSCQTAVRDGMVVHSDSPKAVANQKQVMEYLLINHPLDCPVCDQAGECYLQDYSYQYGRSQSRFEEDKVKQPKKDVGENIILYSDRCIMCTRCVRFTREVSGTCELFVDGRGNKEEIDIFPGKPLNNKLSGNVADICPVGALLDKSFLFKQRVWLLKHTPRSRRWMPAGKISGLITTKVGSTGRCHGSMPRSISGGSRMIPATRGRPSTAAASWASRGPRAQFGTQVETSFSTASSRPTRVERLWKRPRLALRHALADDELRGGLPAGQAIPLARPAGNPVLGRRPTGRTNFHQNPPPMES